MTLRIHNKSLLMEGAQWRMPVFQSHQSVRFPVNYQLHLLFPKGQNFIEGKSSYMSIAASRNEWFRVGFIVLHGENMQMVPWCKQEVEKTAEKHS